MSTERFKQAPATSPTRVVTLAFLSQALPATLLGEKVAQSLGAETAASVVLVRLTPSSSKAVSPPEESHVNGGLQLLSPSPRSDAGFQVLNIRVNAQLDPSGWSESLLEQLRRQFRYVLIEVVADELMKPVLFEFLLYSQSSYLFLQPTAENAYSLDLLIREFRSRGDGGEVRLKPALCLEAGQSVGGYDTLIQNLASPVQVFIRGCPMSAAADARPTGTFHADVRRLAREIGSCLVGLALSSGAAKALSHIGVIQVLEENGVEVDVVAGASMGAYVGAVWTCGFDGQKLEQLAREMESPWAFWKLVDPAFPPRQGFVHGLAVKERLMKSIGHVRFAELVRPLRVLATHLETLERIVFASGEVADAVHASIAVPGICVPVQIQGEAYLDGGIVDPLPVDVLREMGVNRILAVNAIPTPDRIRYCLQAGHELARLSPRRAREVLRKWFPLDEHLNYFARGNILEILMRSIHGGQIRMAEALGRQADIVLRPRICEDNWLDFRNPGRFIQPGRQIAEQHLAEIKALVAGQGAANEPADVAADTSPQPAKPEICSWTRI